MRVAVLFAFGLAGCSLVVGTDPREIDDGDAASPPPPGDDAAALQADAAPVDAGPDVASKVDGADACDVPACLSTHVACKSTCADEQSLCVATCGGDPEEQKSCTDACAKKTTQCNQTCLSQCNACVKGCSGPCPP